MRVLFIYTNVTGFHEDSYSFGLASIISITRQSGYDARFISINKKSDYVKALTAISEFKPKIIGFSSVSSQFGIIKELASCIKQKHPDLLMICGGIHPTIDPKCVLEASALDGVFVGESELSFREFLEKIKNGASYKDTDNFAFSEDGKLVVNKLKPLISDLDIIPYPDKEIYPYGDTAKLGYAPFYFSRGCPYTCTYCSNKAIAERYGLKSLSTRYRSPESSIKEIEETLEIFPAKRIFIKDEIFGLNKKWRDEFCEKYRKRINIKFDCALRANLVDEELIKSLKASNCYRISMGVESGNEYVRNTIMQRHMTDKAIVNAFDLTRKYGIKTCAINIIGVPGETEGMIWDTIRLNRRIKPTTSAVNVFYPYKKTRLGDQCFNDNLVDEELYKTFSNERRDTVLRYSEPFKKKLVDYSRRWELLVYPYDLKKHAYHFISSTFLWKFLRGIKRLLYLARTKCQNKEK